MAGEHLADDSRKWPNDPFQLLAVPRSVDRRTLKRAYTSLIKLFKPEHAPAEFLKIREAYEHIEQMISFREQFEVDDLFPQENDHSNRVSPNIEITPNEIASDEIELIPVLEPESDPVFESAAKGEATSEIAETDEFEILSPPPSDELETIWRVARAGDLATAYAQLQQLALRSQRDELLAERLYWLLKIDPDLAPERRPAEHLIDFVKSSRRWSNLHALLVNELRFDPDVALSEAYGKLIRPDASEQVVENLIAPRWQRAAECDQWSVIEADFARLEWHYQIDAPQLLLRLDIRGVELTLFTQHPDARRLRVRLQKRLKDRHVDALDFSDDFDRLDLLVAVQQELSPSQHDPPMQWMIHRLQTLFQSLILYGPQQAARPLQRFLTEAAPQDQFGLDANRLGLLSVRLPQAMSLLLFLINRLCPEQQITHDAVALAIALQQRTSLKRAIQNIGVEYFGSRFIVSSPRVVPFRQEVIDICLEENIPMHAALDAIFTNYGSIAPSLAELLNWMAEADLATQAYIQGMHYLWKTITPTWL